MGQGFKTHIRIGISKLSQLGTAKDKRASKEGQGKGRFIGI
jgi:hypothetical protein